MAYKPRIESNNLDLTSILSAINELPEAGASVEFGWFSYYGTISKLPFVIGMTWGEWIETYLNVPIDAGSGVVQAYLFENYIVYDDPSGGNKYYVSTDGTQANRVTSSDSIINEFAYSEWRDTSGGGGFDQ